MKPALKALLFAKEHHENILSGQKRITIREGHRDYQYGDTVMLCCHIHSFCKMATISGTAHCTLGEVSGDELRSDGFKDRGDLLEGMKKYYPNITMSSPVTIIYWGDVR